MRTIAIEEHFLSSACRTIVEGAMKTHAFMYDNTLLPKLFDLGEDRLQEMDRCGIDVQVLMHTLIPGAHPDVVQLARETNDQIAEAMAAHPDRYAGFAALPWAHPEAAVAEMKRAVQSLGLNAVMCNGTVNGRFLDDPSFFDIWRQAAELDVAVYIHPAPPPKGVMDAYFEGFDPHMQWLISTSCWGWHSEVGLHALRLIVTGLFDRLPGLQVIIGHMGELFPLMLDRIDDRMTRGKNNLERKISEYFLNNFHISTSGFFSEPPLRLAMDTIGVDRIMFAIDHPYSFNQQGREFLDKLTISDADKAKITHLNAERLLRIGKK
jgi:predicted TIM-barrel fold metal-dependent hydrolase